MKECSQKDVYEKPDCVAECFQENKVLVAAEIKKM